MSSSKSGAEAGADVIAAAFRRLEEGIVARAEETGVKFSFQLSGPTFDRELDEEVRAAELFRQFGQLFSSGMEFVGVERQRGSWGLTYRRDKGLVGGVPVPLRDAGFDVRRRFVERAGDFVTAYRTEIDRVLADRNERVDRARSAAAEADAALALLGLDPTPDQSSSS